MFSSTASTITASTDICSCFTESSKHHGLYCRMFNKSEEERAAKRAEKIQKKEAKLEKKKAKYAITDDELTALQKRYEQYREERESQYPKTSPPEEKPKDETKPHNFSGLKGKGVIDCIREEWESSGGLFP